MFSIKNIIVLFFLVSSLFGSDTNKTKTALEMFMFKAGITSLTYDLENEKKNIYNNSNEIEQLKKDVKYLLEENIKNKLVIKDDTNVVETKTKNIKDLEDENFKLKAYIKKLEKQKKQNLNHILINKYKKAIIFDKKASILVSPYPNSKIVRYAYKNDILKIELCNRYDWCKIVNKDEYIAKYKLYFIGTSK